jgi:hypothetical protein
MNMNSKSHLLEPGAAFLLLVSLAVACGESACVTDSTTGGGGAAASGGGAAASGGGTAASGGGTAGGGGTAASGGGTAASGGGTAGDGGTAGSGGAAGGGGVAGGGGGELDITPPTVESTLPLDLAIDVAVSGNITATFSEAMDLNTITVTAFSLKQGQTAVPAAVTYAGIVATLDPTSNLAPNAAFTATVTTEVTDLEGNAMVLDKIWSFQTGPVSAQGPPPVDLGKAGDFVILSKAGIDTVPTSALTGDIGVSPIDSTAITNFSLILDGSGTFSTSSQLIGHAFAADYTSPTPSYLTTAIGDMEAAATDAAGRATPDFTELGSGDISGLTLVPGLYKWGTGVLMSTDVTLNGGPNDVWIFQIAGGITEASGVRVNLAGGALPKNIFWQTFGAVSLDTTAHLEGIVLSQTEITLATGATVNGRLLSQTAVTLDSSTVTEPAL